MASIPEKNLHTSDLGPARNRRAAFIKIDPNDLFEENKRLESELHLSLEEIAHLQNALANLNMKLAAYRIPSGDGIVYNKEEMAILGEALKQISIPLESISNYCDLLLSESVGILGTLQKKFVDRISIAADQISELLDEFEKQSESEKPARHDENNCTNIHLILEDILTRNAMLLREKQLVLQMEVPDELEKIQGEKKEIYGIIETVLMNAFAITPKDGSICITATQENNFSVTKLLLRVRDGGPGIPPAELKRIFPLGKHEGNAEIPGCSLKRNDLAELIELSHDLGCMIRISNAIGFGCVFELSFNIVERKD